MKVEEWLSNLKYESHGMTIEKIVNGSSVVVIDIKGWSTIVNSLGSENRAAVFQDSVGEFILEAINEKLENDKTKHKIWNKIQGDLSNNINVVMIESITAKTIKPYIGKRCKIYLKGGTTVISTIVEYVRRNIITDSDAYYYGAITKIELHDTNN